jgi:hypothetical protein
LIKDEKIPIAERESLKRNTRNGRLAELEDLEAFDRNMKFVNYDSDSDEETEQDIYNRIKYQIDRKKNSAEWKEQGNVRRDEKINAEFEKLLKSGKELSIAGKKFKYDKHLGIILSGGSELVKKNGKYTVDTNFKVKKGLSKNIKKTLKKSVLQELDKKMKGSGIRSIRL